MKIKSKVWLVNDGGLVFGTGKARIIKAVEQTGSINKAAKKLSMSYRHAWSYLKSAEKRIGEPLLIKSKGGEGGGGTFLTAYARDILCKFEKLDKDIKKFADKRFKEIFDGII